LRHSLLCLQRCSLETFKICSLCSRFNIPNIQVIFRFCTYFLASFFCLQTLCLFVFTPRCWEAKKRADIQKIFYVFISKTKSSSVRRPSRNGPCSSNHSNERLSLLLLFFLYNIGQSEFVEAIFFFLVPSRPICHLSRENSFPRPHRNFSNESFRNAIIYVCTCFLLQVRSGRIATPHNSWPDLMRSNKERKKNLKVFINDRRGRQTKGFHTKTVGHMI